eukprot:403342179
MSETEEVPLTKASPKGKSSGDDIKKGYLLAFVLVVGLGSFQFGYSIGSFTNLQDDFAAIFKWDDDEKAFKSSVITSICQLGSACGALGIGSFTKFGRKNCLLFVNLFVLIGSGIAIIENEVAIIIGRFIYGLATGSFSVLVPGFIGIMFAFLMAIPIPETPTQADMDQFLVSDYWRVLFALPIAIGVIQCLLLLSVFNYDTPKYHKQHNQHAKLNELMGKIYQPHKVQDRIDDILIESGKNQEISYKDTFCNPRYYFATFIGCTLSMLQQLSGINAVMLYASEIFKKVGWSPRLGSALTGVINMVSTFGALFLLAKVGRKTLLWLGSFAMGCIHIGLGIAYFYVNDSEAAKACCVVFIFLFIILFEFSLGPIPWLFMAEIMTPKGLSIAILINWIATLGIAIATPFLISGELFIVFGVFCVICGLFSLILLKETKGLNEAQILALYSKEQQGVKYKEMHKNG